MGTRAIVNILDENGEGLCTIYKHSDGCPSTLGHSIKECFENKKLVCGIYDPVNQVNGMECAAALLVSHLKGDSCGDVYLLPYGSDGIGEEYTYTLSSNGGEMWLSVDTDTEIYNGALRYLDAHRCGEKE